MILLFYTDFAHISSLGNKNHDLILLFMRIRISSLMSPESWLTLSRSLENYPSTTTPPPISKFSILQYKWPFSLSVCICTVPCGVPLVTSWLTHSWGLPISLPFARYLLSQGPFSVSVGAHASDPSHSTICWLGGTSLSYLGAIASPSAWFNNLGLWGQWEYHTKSVHTCKFCPVLVW
jgi:hypothetical protein